MVGEEDNLLPVLLFFAAEEISFSTARTKALIVLGKSFALFLVTRNYSSLHRALLGNEVCVCGRGCDDGKSDALASFVAVSWV